MKKVAIFIVMCLAVMISINGYAQLNCDPERSNVDKKPDFQILTDSSIKYSFGYYCSKAGMPPLGRQAIDQLIKLNDFKSIKAVLDGQNNAGKIYAIEALLLSSPKTVVLTEEDKEKIKYIINKDYIIDRCEGCLFSSIKTIDLFHEKNYMKLLTKSGIKIKNR